MSEAADDKFEVFIRTEFRRQIVLSHISHTLCTIYVQFMHKIIAQFSHILHKFRFFL